MPSSEKRSRVQRARVAWWIWVMDALASGGLFGGRLYYWALARAAAAVDWSGP